MKKTLFFLFILFTIVGCEKEDNDTNIVCTTDCTTISGHILTSGNLPLEGIKINLKYIENGFLYYHSWLKRETTTDANGYFSMSFNIKDDEVETYGAQYSSYFELKFDFNNLDPDKYFLPYYSVSDSSYLFTIQPSLKQDTTYSISCYIPAKDYITVNLNNFKPIQEVDCFEVETFFPWGIKSEKEDNSNKFMNTEYGFSSSGYDNFMAEDENQIFRVPVARNDTNIVRIIKMKNGIASPEDHKIFVPENNKIELTYEY
jgi:hypothetical protein